MCIICGATCGECVEGMGETWSIWDKVQGTCVEWLPGERGNDIIWRVLGADKKTCFALLAFANYIMNVVIFCHSSWLLC